MLLDHRASQSKLPVYADDCFNEAIKKATEAIVLVRDIDSQENIARIEKLCAALQATPYGKGNIDLTSLEIEIAKAQYPQMLQ